MWFYYQRLLIVLCLSSFVVTKRWVQLIRGFYPGSKESHVALMRSSSADSTTPWTDSRQGLQLNWIFKNACCLGKENQSSSYNLPTGSDESVIMMSKASWFCFINSKPSPTWRVSFGLKKPFAMPGRYFLDALMTSYKPDNNNMTLLIK